MAMAMAWTARVAPIRAPVASSGSARVAARRACSAGPSKFRRNVAARRACSAGPSKFRRNVTRIVSPRREVRPAAALGPNEVNELASSTLLTLSGVETLLGKVSFGSLLTATSIYEYKVRVVGPNPRPEILAMPPASYPRLLAFDSIELNGTCPYTARS